MVPSEVTDWLSSISAPMKTVRARVDASVRKMCQRDGYAYLGRDKTDSSVSEKLETGRVESLRDIDDLFACSIIIPNLGVEDAVLSHLSRMFEPVVVKRRGETQKSPEVFRFEATRFVGRLRLSDPDAEPDVASLMFEIQVRTAFEHAWSVATHGPYYKAETADWKLSRLAAQMKALVEQLDALAVAYHESADFVVEHPDFRTECEVRILETFQALHRDGFIPDEVKPERWGLFARNVSSMASAAGWGRRMDLRDKVDTVCKVASREIIALGKDEFPLSLSLYQFILCVIVETRTVSPKFYKDNYFPPVSASMENLYPRTKKITPRCSLKA